MKTTAIQTAILAAFVLAAAHAEERVVWQIGRFDNNYQEFAIPHEFRAYSRAFPQDVTFDAQTHDPAKAWPFIHPGPADPWAGSRVHPFIILFELPAQPKGAFVLSIDLVSTHGGAPPTYEITLNGRRGRLKLPKGTSDEALAAASKGKEYTFDLVLPASVFRNGDNRIVLRSTVGSWILYDALRLTNDPGVAEPEPTVERIVLTPTIRFVRRGLKLKQVIELVAQFAPGSRSCMATVKAGGTTRKAFLRPDLLGAAHCELYIDKTVEPTLLEVTIRSGWKRQTASHELRPQRHWKLYVQPSTHVDVGYTDFQERVIERHNDNMSLALDLCARYPDFKWNTEAAWVQDKYLSMMPDDRRTEFITRAREGRIGCQAVYGNMLTGICSHEELIRDLYYARAMSRKYGIPFDIAMSSDVPTQVWTLPTVLAGAGIKYFSAGLNLTRGNSFNRLFDKSPFYWQGPDGSKVLAWLSPGYAYAAHLGLHSDIRQAETRVGSYLKSFDRDTYPYDAVLAFGGFGDNQPLAARLASTVHEWNKRYAYPKIILCRGPEFFEYMESNFGSQIPTISGDGGVYWEDGAGSSALETAIVRRAKEDLAAAEKLHCLTSTFTGSAYPRAAFDVAWKNAILYDEHTWGAHCSISQPESEQTVHQWEYKARFAQEAARGANLVVRQGLDNLAKMASVKEPSVVVFNPLGWPVSGPVQTKTPDGRPVEFWAEDVPSVGYKVYAMAAVSGQQPGGHDPRTLSETETGETTPPSVSGGGREGGQACPQLENRFYRLELDPSTGAVKSLLDKELGIELVDPDAPYGINQYIYIAGQGKDAKDVTRDSKTLAVVQLAEAIYRNPPGVQTITITGSAYKTPQWITHVILYDKIKRIDFVNTLNKEPTYDKEAGYFAFPFALNKPEFYVELPNGVMKPKADMLDGACMQWYCAQDFVAAADERYAVVWTAVDSPLITIGDVNRETFQSPLPIENGHLYAYVFNNYWFTNYKASQGGELRFRFSLTSMPKYDPVAAARFGQSVRNPLLSRVCENGRAATGAAPTSLCSVNQSNVIIQAVKQAESGEGLIIRLREVAGTTTQATVTLPAGRFKQAWACNLVEDPKSKLTIEENKVNVTVAANGLATILVK